MENTNVNIFLKAKKPIDLIEMQLLNNAVNNAHFNYQTPVFDGIHWYVWFFVDVNNWVDFKTLKDDALKLAKGEL